MSHCPHSCSTSYLTQSLPHPTHHAHDCRITHMKYVLISSLSESAMLSECPLLSGLSVRTLADCQVSQPPSQWVHPTTGPRTLLPASQGVPWALLSQLLPIHQLPRHVQERKKENTEFEVNSSCRHLGVKKVHFTLRFYGKCLILPQLLEKHFHCLVHQRFPSIIENEHLIIENETGTA